MKKIKTSIIAASLAFAHCAYGQDIITIPNLDLEEDTTEVTTVSDIVKMQQKVISNNNTETHYLDMWKRRTYLNIATNTTNFKSDDNQYDFSNDWGVSLQLGYNHRLTKKPIWGMWALDVPCLDINVNHFKSKCDDDGYCYDSSDKNGGYYKTPWNMEKVEANVGLGIGPSYTVAPFATLRNEQLDFIKVNVYWHIGFGASFLFLSDDEDLDRNKDTSKASDREKMASATKALWGLGAFNSFGINIYWKMVGLGYEYRTNTANYKHFNTEIFGEDKTKFKSGTNKFYITFRF